MAERSLAVLDPAFPRPRLQPLITAGIGGLVQAHGRREDWKEAVLSLLKGERHYCRRFRADLFPARLPCASPRSQHPLDHLSPREVQVFQWIGCGYSTREIADRLHRSRKTVETYREHLKTKLDLPDASALSRAARKWVEQGTFSS